eukprot:285152-Chlamydomonas_euryale.AAC.1
MLAEEAAAAAALSPSDDALQPRQVDTRAGPATTSARYADASMLAEEATAAAALSPSDDALHRRHVDTHAGPAT